MGQALQTATAIPAPTVSTCIGGKYELGLRIVGTPPVYNASEVLSCRGRPTKGLEDCRLCLWSRGVARYRSIISPTLVAYCVDKVIPRGSSPELPGQLKR